MHIPAKAGAEELSIRDSTSIMMTEGTEAGPPPSAASAPAWIGPLLLFAYGFLVAFWLWAKWLFAPQLFLLPPLPPVEVLVSLVENTLGPWIVALVTLSSLGLVALDGIKSRRAPPIGWWWKSLLRGALETVLIHVLVWIAGTILFFTIMALLPGSEIHSVHTDDPVVRGLGLFTAFLSLIMSGPITGLVVAVRSLARQRREGFPASSLPTLNHAVAILLVPLATMWVLSGYPRATLQALERNSAHDARDLSAELILAARDGDAAAVTALLRRGAPMNAQGVSGTTALMAAAANAHREIVRTLLQSGADTNVKDESGRTALMTAAANRQAEIVGLLAQAKADVKAKDLEGKTALMLAALAGEPQIVHALLQAGADANAASLQGETALLSASRRGDAEIVRLLVEAGADVNAKNAEGDTALTLARRFNRAGTAAILVAKAREER